MSIENDKVVSMFYTLTDKATGDLLDTNKQANPLEFLFGRGQIIPGLESELEGLSAGDKKQVEVLADQAYGKYDEKLLQTHSREQFAGIELKEGMTLFGQGEDGGQVQVSVKSFNDSEVTVDFNHPLAGKDLNFEVEITEVREASEDELATGVVGGMAGGCGCGTGGCGEHHHDEEEHECCGGGAHHHAQRSS